MANLDLTKGWTRPEALIILIIIIGAPIAYFAQLQTYAKSQSYKAVSCLQGRQLDTCKQIDLAAIPAKDADRIRTFIKQQELIERQQKEALARAQRAEEDARRAAKAEADARFRAEGWWEQQPGIFVRWCTSTCEGSETYMDYAWLMEVWCRDRACGDIYARINIQRGSDGPVVAWTNETGYGDIGQKVVLTFQSGTPGSASLTEFIARG